MNKYWLSVLAPMLFYVPAAMAIDRDAKMIDSAAMELMELDDADGIGVAVWGETAFNTDPQIWAVIMKAAYGELSPNDEGDTTYLGGALGLKYYIQPETSVALIGDFTSFDANRDAKMAYVAGKHRLAPATESISPYLAGSVGVRERSTFSRPSVSEDSFSELVFTFGGGVEFRMTEALSFIFDVNAVQSEESDDGTENWDGFRGFVGLQYYFMPEEGWNK